MKKSTKNSLFTYALVIAAFVVVQILRAGPGVGSLLEGQLVPICAYIVMALSLNLVVGISGELSRHAHRLYNGDCPGDQRLRHYAAFPPNLPDLYKR